MTTLTATYLDPAGDPCKGTVTFELSAAVFDSDQPAIRPQVRLVETLDGDGQISTELMPYDDPGLTLVGTLSYRVTERIQGAPVRTYFVAVPLDANPVDLGTLAPQGTPGTVTSLRLVPAGGDEDQVLAKASGDDYDLAWVDQTGGGGGAVDSVNGQTGTVVLDSDDIDDTGKTNQFATAAQLSKLDWIEAGADVTDAANVAAAGAVMATLADAKGDLIVATAADTVTRLAVGTNDHVLTADSAQATGVKWAAASGIAATLLDAKGDLIAASAADTAARVGVGSAGAFLMADSGATAGVSWAPLFITPLTGEYAFSQYLSGNAVRTGTLSRLYFTPIFVQGWTADRITCRVDTGGSTGAVIRLGIYGCDSYGRPGALLLDAGTVDTTGTGVKSATISQALPIGTVWLAAVAQTATCSWRFHILEHTGLMGAIPSNLSTVPEIPGKFGYYQDSVTGALPASATPVVISNDYPGPVLTLRRS